MTDDPKKRMNVFDYILVAVGVGILCALIVVFVFGKKGNVAFVYQNNSEIARISLDKDGVYKFDSEDGGYNTVVVENGEIFVREADCKGLDCVKRGRISSENESIICLPHKLSIIVKSGKVAKYTEVIN